MDAGFLQAALLNHSIHSVLVTCTSKYPPKCYEVLIFFMQYTFAQLQISTCVSPPRSFSPSSSLPPPRWQKVDRDTTGATRTAEVIPPSSTFVPLHIFSSPSNGLFPTTYSRRALPVVCSSHNSQIMCASTHECRSSSGRPTRKAGAHPTLNSFCEQECSCRRPLGEISGNVQRKGRSRSNSPGRG